MQYLNDERPFEFFISIADMLIKHIGKILSQFKVYFQNNNINIELKRKFPQFKFITRKEFSGQNILFLVKPILSTFVK